MRSTMSTTLPLTLDALPERRRLADRVFRFAVAVNIALTLFALLASFTGFGARIAGRFVLDTESIVRVLIGIAFFNGLWALIWYGVKNLLLKSVAGFSK